MRKLLVFFFFILFSTFSVAQSFESKVDSIILSTFSMEDNPGAVFLVSKQGVPIYKKAFGKANLELGVEMTTANVFQIGSMTKQFTAIAILLLSKQGKLSVEDPIAKYIPDYPNGKNITIRHLLNHTSGIKDFTKMKTISTIAQKEMTPQMMVDFFKNEPVDFKPGEKFEYNNSGYVLLGYIIELTSGLTYQEYIEQNIFKKIGMSNSYYASDRSVIKNRAYGYHLKKTGYVNKTVINFSVPYSSGALMSTVDDMLKWQNALKNHVLLGASDLASAFQKNKLNSGEEVDYGFGWHLKNINGMPTMEHGGSVFGFKSMAVYIPDKDIYVIGLSNCDCHSPTDITREIAKLTLDN
ncbi:serine hydrolase domain-containing protein [Sphingobacterium sp.]|uniref:serine hydrolase domain-containing protein n=1 Tax=Sphingobacterium sp. TaxID=341027 RepID=UPI0031E41252